MKRKVKRWPHHRMPIVLVVTMLGIILCSSLVIVNMSGAGAAPSKSTPTPPAHGGKGQSQSERVNQLKAQGHLAQEIERARDLEDKTGVPMETWLDSRQSGKSWADAMDELGEGKVTVVRLEEFSGGRDLTETEMGLFMAAGFGIQEIWEANKLSQQWGSNPLELLELRKQGKTWDEIAPEEEVRWRAASERQYTKYDFAWGDDGKATHTPSGMDKQQVAEVLAQGYTLSDLLSADTLATGLGLDIKTFIAAKPESLKNAVQDHYLNMTPADRISAQQNKSKPATEVRVGNIIGVHFAEGRTTTLSGLSSAEVVELIAQGHILQELMSADSLAYALGLDFRQIIKAKNADQSWNDAIQVAHDSRPLAERRVHNPSPTPPEDEMLRLVSASTGKSISELKNSRSEGQTWRQILGISEEHLDRAMQTAAIFGLSDRELVHQALLQGLTVADARQAAILAPATTLSASEILFMKTETNTWREVLQVLFPGKDIPEEKKAAPGGGN